MNPGILRGIIATIAMSYLVLVLFPTWLPSGVSLMAAVIITGLLAFVWNQAGRPHNAFFIGALALPLHLLIVATGGLGSPLLPLFLPWLLILVVAWPLRRAISTGGAVLGWLLFAQFLAGGPGVGAIVETTLIFTGGILPGWVLRGGRWPRSGRDRELGQELGELEPGASESGGSEVERRVEELAATLGRIRESLGGARVLLWEIDPEADRARPRLASGGPLPLPVILTGDPMRLATEDSAILRLETAPRWAQGAARVCMVPVEHLGEYSAVLTIEYENESPFPTTQALEGVAAQLRALLDMQREAARASATREQFSMIVGLLRRLPERLEPGEFAGELAAAAADFAGMSGAAVASWDQDVGHLLALVGDAGGPEVGAAFGLLESELALAARHATTLIRQRDRGETGFFPILAPGERWLEEPRSIVVVPLQGAANGVVGVLAIWNVEPVRVDPELIDVLEMVAPYAAMQLHQLQIYGPLREFAERDALTGLYNRRIFDDRMAAEEAHFLRYRRPTSLIVLDLDHFKAINDTLGHEAGDAVLREVGALLRATVRGSDLVARLGGEEFVVLLPETALAGALEIAHRLRVVVEAMTVEWRDEPIEVRASLGVAACPECALSPETLLQAADAALYTSKREGRNRVSAAPYGVFQGSAD
jgi:diguanylate cyclase (GGDEF)-like protein